MNYTQTNKLMDYRDFRVYGDTFIETGTSAGDGVKRALHAGFPRIYSIEASELWYRLCVGQFRENKNVTLYLGKSVDVLNKVTFPQPAIFFLDAHPSASNSYGYEEVAQGKSEYTQDNIIRSELEIILKMYTNPTIIIDDQSGLSRYNKVYISMMEQAGLHTFEFYDENLSGNHLYKDKLLVGKP